MPNARQNKGRKTLSDLLADDVRDYFLREGVPDEAPPPRRARGGGNNGKRRPKPTTNRSVVAPTTTNDSSVGGSLRVGWVAGAGGGGNLPSKAIAAGEEERRDRERQQQQQRLIDNGGEQQFRFPRAAEVDGDDRRKTHERRASGGSVLSKSSVASHHRRHSSGGGSVGSKGSRCPIQSAADAEFLRRYAEEKERTNKRMSVPARPVWGISPTAAEERSPNGGGPYHSLLNAPRPPTVAGSHRPGLPSIDNDDWELDDRIERHEARRMVRKEARRAERHRRRTSSMGGDGASSVVEHSPSFVAVARSSTMPSAGSVTNTPGSELYRSESSTLCYSTASSYAFPPEMPYQRQQQQQQQMQQQQEQHTRGNSMGTFVRSGSSHSLHTAEAGDGGGARRQERYPQQESTPIISNHAPRDAKQTKSPQNRHVRPLSYLSASSDSSKDSPGERAPRDANRSTTITHKGEGNSSPNSFEYNRYSSQSTNFTNPSYQTSSLSATYRNHPHQKGLTRDSSAESSMQTSLLGSSIIDSTVSGGSRMYSGESGSQFTRMSNISRMTDSFRSIRGSTASGAAESEYQRERRYADEESSYDSDESSEESSYTSDSYDEDSSFDSQSLRRGAQGRYGKNSKSNGTYSNRVPENGYLDRRDVEAGRSERDRLVGGSNRGPNYFSSETAYPPHRKPPKNRKKSTSTRKDSRRKRSARLGGPGGHPLRLDDAIEVLVEKCNAMLVMMELFISNMPSLVGSLSLAWVSLGVDWFKWYEETFDACHPTAYHDASCIFAEFPGCFACDTQRGGYQFFLHFHYVCSTIAFVLSSFLVGKIMIAFPVVRDELANPTTAAPLGLLCMAFEKVFAGNFGLAGKGITFVASGLHTAVAGWFIFISVVYKTLPEPSWFPNTTGIGLAAAKIYLYWTGGGYFLAGFSVLLFSLFYCIALYRIHTNEKISAPVCWVQLSGPAVVLYGFTIFSQPGSDEADIALLVQENHDHFFQVHRTFYMPIVHMLFAFCMVSMVSSLYLLSVRWKSFRDKQFSPAHVSFCAPLISHTNAMQAYRSSLNKFSMSPPDTVFKTLLYRYWASSLICGTVLLFVMSWKFFSCLPSWCQIDVEDDEMPPAPDETLVTRLLQNGEAGDSMKQDFVSAAVLQANESGALVRVLQDGKMKYVRSRRMPSMGFDPIMDMSQFMSERDRLLQHVTYAADPNRDRAGMSSFDDFLHETYQKPDILRPSMGRRKLNFMSFDASTMMRPS